MSDTLKDIVPSVLKKMAVEGLSNVTINDYRCAYDKIISYCSEHGITEYNEKVGQSFIRDIVDKRYSVGTVHNKRFHTFVKRLDCAILNTEWIPGKGGRRKSPYAHSCFDDIVSSYDRYLYSCGLTEKDLRNRVHSVAHALALLEKHGLKSLSDLSAKDIYSIYCEITDKDHFRSWFGAFLKYTYKYGMIKEDISHYIPKYKRHQPVPSVYSDEEISRLLNSIDRSTSTGKRNYAIILLIARLGLRACDTAALTFDAVNERLKQVQLYQKKTGVHLSLPWFDDVKAAIDDYVQNARQDCNDCHVFLMIRRNEPLSPANIGKIVELAFIGSGIDCGNRKKGSHSLRASLATSLLNAGNSHLTIMQALGQTRIESTKYYAKASIEILRANALPVSKPSGYFQSMIEGI